VVFADQPAYDAPALDPGGEVDDVADPVQRRVLLQPLVWPVPVVVPCVLGQNLAEMPLAEDQRDFARTWVRVGDPAAPGPPYLFLAWQANTAGARHYRASTLTGLLTQLAAALQVTDATGAPVDFQRTHFATDARHLAELRAQLAATEKLIQARQAQHRQRTGAEMGPCSPPSPRPGPRRHASRRSTPPVSPSPGGTGAGPRKGEIDWKPLAHHVVLRVLHNPRYAGAFTFGRHRDIRLPGGKLSRTALPREEWLSFIPGAHPGYLTLEQYDANRARLTANAAAHGRTGPPDRPAKAPRCCRASSSAGPAGCA
jgi:hypothetical protein